MSRSLGHRWTDAWPEKEDQDKNDPSTKLARTIVIKALNLIHGLRKWIQQTQLTRLSAQPWSSEVMTWHVLNEGLSADRMGNLPTLGHHTVGSHQLVMSTKRCTMSDRIIRAWSSYDIGPSHNGKPTMRSDHFLPECAHVPSHVRLSAFILLLSNWTSQSRERTDRGKPITQWKASWSECEQIVLGILIV